MSRGGGRGEEGGSEGRGGKRESEEGRGGKREGGEILRVHVLIVTGSDC